MLLPAACTAGMLCAALSNVGSQHGSKHLTDVATPLLSALLDARHLPGACSQHRVPSGLTNHDKVVYAEGNWLHQDTGRQAPLLLLHLHAWQQFSICSTPLM